MTDPTSGTPGETPDDWPNAPPHDAPAMTPPIGTGRSLALGCSGFVGFFFVASIVGGAMSAGGAMAIVTLVVVVGLLVAAVVRARRQGQRAQAIAARVAIGFGVAAVLFGGCIAIISQASFH